MKQDWKMVKLGEVLKISRHQIKLLPEQNYKQITIKMNRKGVTLRGLIQGSQVGSNQYTAKSNQFIISKIDARNGAYGIVSNELEGAIVTGDFMLFDPSEHLDVSFLNFFSNTRSFDFECKKASEGTTNRVRLKIEKFLQIEIPLPPLSEQQRIAGRLAALKEKIDAVRVLRGEQLREVKRVTQNFGEQFFEELGKEVTTKLFEEICDVVRGGSPRPAGDPTFYGDGYLPFLKIGDLTNDNEIYVQGYAETLTKAGLTKTRVVKPNTLLLTNSGATLGVPKITAFKTAFNDGIQAFINFKEDVNLEYLYFFLKSKTGHFRKILARGQGQPNLNTEMVKKTSIPLPSLSEQHRIVSEIKAFQAKMDALKSAQAEQLSALEGLFPGVLEQAFRGEW